MSIASTILIFLKLSPFPSNFTTEKSIKTETATGKDGAKTTVDTIYTAEQYCARIAGLIAGIIYHVHSLNDLDLFKAVALSVNRCNKAINASYCFYLLAVIEDNKSDIPASLSDTTVEQVKLAMIGYVNAPSFPVAVSVLMLFSVVKLMIPSLSAATFGKTALIFFFLVPLMVLTHDAMSSPLPSVSTVGIAKSSCCG